MTVHAITSTCTRDLDLVRRLHRQLREHGINHTLFVENHELGDFSREFDDVLIKPDGGDNGFGAEGTLVRWACHQQMLQRVKPEDTFVNIDSDVYFANLQVLADITCGKGELRGFMAPYANGVPRNTVLVLPSNTPRVSIRERLPDFQHVSGMIIAVAGDVFIRAMSLSRKVLIAVCDQLYRANIPPSEDVVASYLYQTRGNARHLVNFHDKYTRHLARNYTGPYDVIC